MPHEPTPPSPRKLRLALVAFAVLAVVAAGWGVTARARSEHQLDEWTRAQSVPTVQLAPLSAPAGGHAMTLPGHVEAWASAPLHARVGGYLKRWTHDIGSPVEAGAVLATIETPELDQQLLSARAALARAQASERLAQSSDQRWRKLLSTNSVSRQEADEKHGEAEVAQANVQSAEAEVARLQALAAFKTLSAPFAGTVTSRSADVGQLISATDASSPPLFTISDTRRMRLYVRVPQNQAGAIVPGMTVALDVPEHPGRRYQARLIGSSDAVDRASGSLLAQFEIPNSDHSLLAGDYADVSLPEAVRTQVTSVPATVLLFRAQGAQVAVVGPGDRVLLKAVHIAVDHGDTLEIDQGITAGDRVIDHPSDSIAQGDAVHVAPTGEGSDAHDEA